VLVRKNKKKNRKSLVQRAQEKYIVKTFSEEIVISRPGKALGEKKSAENKWGKFKGHLGCGGGRTRLSRAKNFRKRKKKTRCSENWKEEEVPNEREFSKTKNQAKRSLEIRKHRKGSTSLDEQRALRAANIRPDATGGDEGKEEGGEGSEWVTWG